MSIICSGSDVLVPLMTEPKKYRKAWSKILQKAGISFAILGVEEKCTGDFARRVGNEMLYQMMAQENIETLNNYKVKKIITACPIV